MAETQFTETEALLIAMQDAEADSGNTDALDSYLRQNFLPGELLSLAAAAGLLYDQALEIRRELRAAEDTQP